MMHHLLLTRRTRSRASIAGWTWVIFSVLALAACGDSPVGPLGALEDGQAGRWSTASPEAVGLDLGVLSELEDRIDQGDFGQVSSVLLLRDGVLAYERYWSGWGAGDLHPVFSVTKSVSSLLIGIVDGDGDLPPLETPALDLFPEYPSVALPAEKDEITLQQVLQMRAGFEWDELSTNYSEPVNPTAALVASPDWIKYVLDLPLSEAPGSSFTYNSGVSMLMSGVIRNEIGTSAEDLAAARLFAPLGIDRWAWSVGPQALTNTGWGLELRPRDMAALGQLVLDRGTWAGTSVVPATWIEESAVAATRFTDGSGYGYQWWLGREDGGGSRALAGWGYGGQFIVVIPSLGVVMVSTAENYEGGGFNPYTLADFAYRAAGALVP